LSQRPCAFDHRGERRWTRRGGNDGVVEYSSAHLEGVDSEYIVRSTHSTQSNPYTIEDVRRILLIHAADVCRRIACGQQPGPSSAGTQALTLR
jgi:hypothetical protein